MNLTEAWRLHKMNAYQMTRYYLLNEIRYTRARLRVGTSSEAHCRRDRKYFQRELFKLRQTRKGT